MKVLIFSDSHCRSELMNNITTKFCSKIDAIFHLGDCTEDTTEFRNICPGVPLYQVRGNNDFENGCPSDRTIHIGGHTIYMTHGHRQRVYYDTNTLYYTAAQNGADIALFGHTHVPYLENEGGILILNPGSISLPRSNAGNTFAFLTFEGPKIEAAIMSCDNNELKKISSLHT